MYGINDYTCSELEELFQTQGLPKFRARQVFVWLGRGIGDFEQMSDLPKALRDRLGKEYTVKNAVIEQKLPSDIDDTVKYLMRMNDGSIVEAVVMRYKHGNTICLSTQVGCRMGCGFCASALGGLERCLTAGEMLSQIYAVQEDLDIKISNIVLMGIGEPLDNYDNVIKFLVNVNDIRTLNIGYRHISLSTCGLVEGIYRLAEEKMPITLSISLHGADDETRSSLMPVNKKYPVAKLLAACRHYISKTHRRISFEYILIDGINDTDYHGDELARLLKGMLCHVNLIPANYVEECGYTKSPPGRVRAFQKRLEERGVNVTVRRELGKDINASCGQLRKKHGR